MTRTQHNYPPFSYLGTCWRMSRTLYRLGFIEIELFPSVHNMLN